MMALGSSYCAVAFDNKLGETTVLVRVVRRSPITFFRHSLRQATTTWRKNAHTIRELQMKIRERGADSGQEHSRKIGPRRVSRAPCFSCGIELSAESKTIHVGIMNSPTPIMYAVTSPGSTELLHGLHGIEGLEHRLDTSSRQPARESVLQALDRVFPPVALLLRRGRWARRRRPRLLRCAAAAACQQRRRPLPRFSQPQRRHRRRSSQTQLPTCRRQGLQWGGEISPLPVKADVSALYLLALRLFYCSTRHSRRLRNVLMIRLCGLG